MATNEPAASPGQLWRLWDDPWLRLGAATALVLLLAAPFAWEWLAYWHTHSITDDAFVQTHVVNVAPQEVSGHLVRYLVQEDDVVAAGQLLAEIDPVPYREQVALLEARLDVAEAQLSEARAALELLQAQVPRESVARLGRAVAAWEKVEAARQVVRATAHQARKAEQALELAEARKLEIKRAERQVEARKRQMDEAGRSLAVAKMQLRYARIVAPFPGVVVHLYRHLGDHVPAGTPVLSLYNPELTYVEANLEETKLPGVAPGNSVRLDVDAFDEPFKGRVVWINRATRANFALVPRNVSSGEFTKVVQRVPVRILVEKDERWPLLRAGLSVTVSIEHGPGDLEWAKKAADAMRDLEATVEPGERDRGRQP
jgi:membrane fusion protein (multidrug efflux system)